jgi:hypothetical protein
MRAYVGMRIHTNPDVEPMLVVGATLAIAVRAMEAAIDEWYTSCESWHLLPDLGPDAEWSPVQFHECPWVAE